MQLTDVWCYALLTITMAATCIQANSNYNEVDERRIDKRISRKTSTVLVDSPRMERMFQNPKLIYKRISRKRYTPPKASYGSPRPKYAPSLSYNRPGKKYRTKHTSKRVNKNVSGPNKRRGPKPKYGVPHRQTMKPVYGPPKIQRPHFEIDNFGFGEPPKSYVNVMQRPKQTKEYSRPHSDIQSNLHFENSFSPRPLADDFSPKPNYDEPNFSSPASFSNDFLKPFDDDNLKNKPFSEYTQGYGEPPVDSYGAPIKPNLRDLTFSNPQPFNPAAQFDEDFHFGSDLGAWKHLNDDNQDNHYAYSKKQPLISTPDDTEVYVTPAPKEHNEEMHLNSYSDIYNYRQKKDKKKKNKNYLESVKILNQPWTDHKVKGKSDEEIIIGGQYAEPPARYVPKFMTRAPMNARDNTVFSPPLNYQDHDAISSATISSYVNYKNSNMAFSPQNLNDAFSIVDK